MNTCTQKDRIKLKNKILVLGLILYFIKDSH